MSLRGPSCAPRQFDHVADFEAEPSDLRRVELSPGPFRGPRQGLGQHLGSAIGSSALLLIVRPSVPHLVSVPIRSAPLTGKGAWSGRRPAVPRLRGEGRPWCWNLETGVRGGDDYCQNGRSSESLIRDPDRERPVELSRRDRAATTQPTSRAPGDDLLLFLGGTLKSDGLTASCRRSSRMPGRVMC